TERHDLQRMAERLTQAAPTVTQVLSRADRELLDGILTPSVPADELIGRAHARRRHGTPETVLTRDLRHLLRTEAPPRFMAAALRPPSAPAAELIGRGHARRRHGTPATVLTRDLRHLRRREAPPRFMAASRLTR